MKLNLELLASTNIKRKKPWPQIVWIGDEYESLLLLDQDTRRASVLYVPSGKTKRRINKVSPLIQDTVAANSTRNGHFLLGLQHTGEVFVWYKDKDIVKTIRGLEGIVQPQDLLHGQAKVYASDDLSHVVVTVATDRVYIWDRNGAENGFSSSSPDLVGTWNGVTVPKDIDIPRSKDCKEFSSDVIFFTHQSLGQCCQCSMIFNNSVDLCVVTLLLRFNKGAKVHSENLASFHVEWNVIQYPFDRIVQGFQPINSRGSLVTSYTRTGQVIAVAANQNRPSKTSVLFVSPLTDTVLVSNLKGCGVRDQRSKRGRNYWVSDISWTSDDLFLACMMKSGLVCLITRLGEPMVIQTITNRGVEMGPSHFLPLHPLQIISADNEGHVFDKDGRPVSPCSTTSDLDTQRQRFSVTTHPSLPIILFSDGFMVTVAQMREDMTNLTLMRDLLIRSSQHLKDIRDINDLDLAVFDAYSLPSHREGKHGKSVPEKQKKSFRFEEPENLNSTLDSDLSLIEQDKHGLAAMNAGKISFAECDSPVIDPDNFSGLTGMKLLMRHFQTSENYLTSIWRLAVSYPEPWNNESESVVKRTINSLIKLFAVMLECPGIENILSKDRQASTAAQNPRLFSVIQTYRKTFELLRFDIINQNLMAIALKFVNDSLTLVLNSQTLQKTDPRMKTLSGCYALLKFSESLINRVYMWVPKDAPYTGLPPDAPGHQKHAYEPAILMKAQMSPRSAAREIIYADPRTLGLDQQAQLPGRRLCGSWKLLYKALVQYQTHVYKTGLNREVESVNNLVFAVEQTIRQIDGEVPLIQSPKISKGERYSLDGMHTMAVDAWQNQLKAISDKADGEKMVQVLHSVLYTFIMRGELGKAVDFVDSLVVQVNVKNALTDQLPQCRPGQEKPPLMTIMACTLKSQESIEPQFIPCIKDRPVRQLVQTMARFMSAYFTNQTMYIFPPHSPQPLPSVHMGASVINSRIIPQYHSELNSKIAKDGLSKTWSTERALEYLLLSGLVCEAAWFADKMGDWKAGFLLSVGCEEHRKMIPKLYNKKRKPLQLPGSLLPEAILKQKLEALIRLDRRSSPTNSASERNQEFIPIDDETNIVQLSRTLEDILLAGVISNIEIVPWLLSILVEKLKQIVSRLSPLVPQDFYLPAPPMYCPQPADTSQEGKPKDVEKEKKCRFQASSLIQMILLVMNSSHISLPAIRWYIKELAGIQERAAQFKTTTEGPCLEIPDVLQDLCATDSALGDIQRVPAVRDTLKCVRDFYTLLWLLHCRDKLSYNLRSREAYLNNVNYQDYVRDSCESKDGEQWIKECFTTLQWAVHMLTFSRFLPDEGCIYKVILSLLHELPNTEKTADILAEHFYDAENLDVEVQEKLEKFLDDWKSVIIEPEDDGKSAKPEQQEAEDDESEVRKSVTFYEASPRGKSLSVYFTKQCEVVMKLLKKKSKMYGVYEEFVFDESGKIPCGTLTSTMPLDKSIFSIGSRPFETKLSFLEFLDTFSAITYTKLLDTEKRGSNAPLPFLLPFADDICKEQFLELDNKIKRHGDQNSSLIILSSPRGKFARSQAESQTDSKGSRQKSQGLFRSLSNGQEQKSQSPQKTKETTYSQPSVDQAWSLDVNFGRKYDNLKYILHWLAVWSQKQHSLGLNWKGEKDLAFKPAMRIEVHPQLVLLSFWLIEHKYCPVEKQQPTNGSLKASSSLGSQANQMHIQDIAQHVNAQVLDAVRRKTNGKHPRRKKKGGQNPGTHSGSGLESSGNQTGLDEDTNQIKSAYQDVLNGNDSSSLEVSSLELHEYGEELKPTLTLINEHGSMRNSKRMSRRQNDGKQNISTLDRTYYQSPERRHESRSQSREFRSPDRGHSRTLDTSTPISQRSSRRRSRDRREVREEEFVSRNVGHGESGYHGNQGNGFGNDLAQQLQQIVRGELRRMMEAQHRSMMAMMGAFDDTMTPEGQARNYPKSRSEDYRSSRRGDSRREASPQRNTMTVEELHTAERVRTQRSSPGRRPQTNEALAELRNLQESTQRPRRKSRSPSQGRSPGGEGQPLTVSALQGGAHSVDRRFREEQNQDGELYPRFLRVSHAERDISDVPNLPPIPMPAWTEDTRPKEIQVSQYGIPQMPLLQLDRGPAPQITPRPQVGSSMPQFPASQPYHPPPRGEDSHAPYFAPPPPSSLVYQQEYLPPPPQMQAEQRGTSQGSRLIEMPLLKLVPEEKPFLGEPTFGRLIDPSVLVSEEQRQEQAEMERQRPIMEFFKEQTDLLEAQRKEKIGKQLLKADLKSPQKIQDKEPGRSRMPRRRQRQLPEPSESETEVEKEKSLSVRERVATPQKELSETQRPPVVSSEGPEEEEEETEEDVEAEKIYDGYAIQPGSFENYLEMDQKDFEADTNARIQYKTAMIMKQQRAREKRKKVDFSTMTKNYEDAEIETGASLEMEQRRFAEAATSITKDTGVDPIQEAILQYNRARQGVALPPDIYLGLRFNDGEGQPGSDIIGDRGEKPKGRSYINVVDLDAEAVLNDLSRKPDKEMQQDLGFKSQSATLTSAVEGQGQDLSKVEESMREALRPRGEPGPVQVSTKQDSVTVKMFESTGVTGNRLSVAVLPRESVQGSRGAILERLRDMGRQMEAIDQMSSNVERGFQNTKLMLGTLEALTDVDEGEPVRKSTEDSVRKSKEKMTPKKSARTPTVSARTTARTPKTSSIESRKETADLVKMSGLSGISDIIGEMVEKGDIDLEEAGFSEQEAVRLADKLKTSARSAHTVEEQDRIRKSLEYLENISREARTEEEARAKEEERAHLHAWMLEKRSERMREYKQKRSELREHERRPFKPDQDSAFKTTYTTGKDRKLQGKSDMRHRLQEAQDLMGDILMDKPELPPDLPARERSPKRKRSPPRDQSPRYKTRDFSPSVKARDRSPMYGARDVSPLYRPRDQSPVYQRRDGSPKQQTRTLQYGQRDVSPKRQTVTISPEVKRKEYHSHIPVAQYKQTPVKAPLRRDKSPAKEQPPPPVVPRLKLMDSDEFMQKTGETTGEINAYQKIVEEMEESQEFTPVPRKPAKEKEPDVPSGKVYKQKSFKDLVRLQRPEITRKKPPSQAPMSEAMMEELGRSSDEEYDTERTTHRELSVREKERLYGSKHLPGEMKRRSPRQVKTYAERLKEMKSKQKYSTPIVPRSHAPSVRSVRTSQETVRRRPTGPAHKPLTYVEQLQKLNKPSHHKQGPGMKTVKMQTFMKSHKPLHKQKTYVEQLRGLQPPPPAPRRMAGTRKVRPRPYADPYRTEGEAWERDSVLSDWSVDDNVRRLLYDDESSSMAHRTSYGAMSVDYTVTEGGSDYYDFVMGDDYVGSVDIDEIAQIADAASVRSGSVMSVIDWDAVEDLIADVK